MAFHRRAPRLPRGQAGFGYAELLVCVLIILILSCILFPNFFRAMEHARISEGHRFVETIRQAQERHMANHGRFIVRTANLGKLDIDLAGSSPTYGLRNFSVNLSSGTRARCRDGSQNYALRLTRLTPDTEPRGPGVPNRYAGYSILYEHCLGGLTYPGCPEEGIATTCDTDFGGLTFAVDSRKPTAIKTVIQTMGLCDGRCD